MIVQCFVDYCQFQGIVKISIYSVGKDKFITGIREMMDESIEKELQMQRIS